MKGNGRRSNRKKNEIENREKNEVGEEEDVEVIEEKWTRRKGRSRIKIMNKLVEKDEEVKGGRIN